MLRPALPLVLAALVSACGSDSSPTAPTTPRPTSIAGNWTGTATYTPPSGGQRVVVAMTATFTQATANFTGQYEMAGGTRGTLSGVMNATAMTASQDFVGGNCSGSASVSGTASGTNLRWNVPSVASSNCTWFTNVEIVLNR